MAHCLWHAIEYQGGSCPRCWEEKQQERLTSELERISAERVSRFADLEEERARREEELADRIEESNLEAAYQMAAAAEEQQRNIAHAPRLESQATSERASELYQVGLYEDAFQTSLKALNLDLGNMSASQIAAWALIKQGRDSEASQYFHKQVALLNAPDYKNVPGWFRSVLLGLPHDDAVSRAFSHALRKNSEQWNSSNDSFELIDALLDRKLLDDAKAVTENLIANCDSLMLEAYLLEINVQTGMSSTERLSAFLQSVPFNRRSHLLDSFQVISNRKGRLSDITISRIKAACCERYSQWKPQIENEISENAIKGASGSGFAVGGGCASIVVCFVILIIIANILHSTPRQHLWLVTDGMKIFAPISVLASIVIGSWAGHLIGGFRKAGNARRKMETMGQQENQTWHSIYPTSISAPRSDLTFIFLEFILFLIAFGLIPFGLFSYMSNEQELAMKAAGISKDGQRYRVTDTKSQPTPSTQTISPGVNGIWVGEWSNPTSSPGFLFLCEIELKTNSANEVSGSIRWNLRKSPSHAEQPKVSQNAVENVRGTYDPESRVASIEGYKKNDPRGIIVLDKYKLILSVDGETLSGKTYSSGAWDGELFAHRKTPQMKGASINIEGTYYIYRLENPASGVLGVMTITLRDNGFMVQGDNEDWQAEGRINGIHGYYDWKFKDGRNGRTIFTVNSDGTLKGHVLGSGEDWWYVARRK
jgi:tetratricopeptide (TPR) repeat protein